MNIQTILLRDRERLDAQVLSGIDSLDIPRRMKRRFKLRYRVNEAFRDDVLAEISYAAEEQDGLVNAQGEIDWEAIAAFLERILPLILELFF